MGGERSFAGEGDNVGIEDCEHRAERNAFLFERGICANISQLCNDLEEFCNEHMLTECERLSVMLRFFAEVAKDAASYELIDAAMRYLHQWRHVNLP